MSAILHWYGDWHSNFSCHHKGYSTYNPNSLTRVAVFPFFFQTGDYSVPYKAWLPFKTLGVCVGGGALIHILRFPTDSSSSIRPPRSQSLFSEHLGPWLQPALVLTLSPSCSRPYVKLEDLCYPNKNITEVLLQSKERDIILASLQAMHYTWTDSQRVQPNPALSR